MRKTLLATLGCLCGIMGLAQNDAATTTKEATIYSITSPEFFRDYAIVQELANQGDIPSILFLGHMHLVGLGVEVNEDLSFKYYMKAAQMGNLGGEYHVGRAYMMGYGCEIDFDKALYWLSRSAEHGNHQADYLIGYSYLKGLGVPQDYQKAMEWFELTSYPMAKHWLGNCYYFGYGVPKDTQKAIQYYEESHTSNSKKLLKLMAQNVKEQLDTIMDNQLKEKDTPKNTGIGKEAIETLAMGTAQRAKGTALKPKHLNGNWKGKLIQLDWSGKQIMQVLPLSCGLSERDGKVDYKWEINGTTNEATALWESNALYFNLDELILVFDKLMGFDCAFDDDPYVNNIYWRLLSAQMELKTVNKKTYLVGNLETFNPIWREPGPPMRIILKQTGEDDDELTDDELLAISQQEDHFIVLYPNPFVNDVLIAYQLDTEAQVSVKVYDLIGNPVPATLEPGAWQAAGKHQYTLNGANLTAGMYIVRVTVGNQVHSRILVKQ